MNRMEQALKIIIAAVLLTLGAPAWGAGDEYDQALDFPLLEIQKQYLRQAPENQSSIEDTGHVFDAFTGLRAIDDEEGQFRAAIDAALLLKKRAQALIKEKRQTETTYQKVVQLLSNVKNMFAPAISPEVAQRQVRQMRDRKHEALERIEKDGLIVTADTVRFIEEKETLLVERQVVEKFKQVYLAETFRNNALNFLEQLELRFQYLRHHLADVGGIVEQLAEAREKNVFELALEGRDDVIRLADEADGYQSLTR